MTNQEFIESIATKYDLKSATKMMWCYPLRGVYTFIRATEKAITITFRNSFSCTHMGQKTFRKQESFENFLAKLTTLVELGEFDVYKIAELK